MTHDETNFSFFQASERDKMCGGKYEAQFIVYLLIKELGVPADKIMDAVFKLKAAEETLINIKKIVEAI